MTKAEYVRRYVAAIQRTIRDMGDDEAKRLARSAWDDDPHSDPEDAAADEVYCMIENTP